MNRILSKLFRGSSRVLLLDDDASMRKLVGRILRKDGFSVVEAVTGREAIAALQSDRRFDVILLDVMMPHEGGATVVHWLRDNAPDVLPRVILLTGTAPSLVRSLEEGIWGRVAKPFDPDALLASIHACVRGES